MLTVRTLAWQSCQSCPCSMFPCLSCACARGFVFVCAGHVLLLCHLLVSLCHAPLFSPRLFLVSLIVLTWSSSALVPLYCVPLPHVFACVYVVLRLVFVYWSFRPCFPASSSFCFFLSFIFTLAQFQSFALDFWSFIFGFYLDLVVLC